ncbi:uncharacterized protein [Venturia canescens]|uniref:uncharacterized protein n=1 Tax=Venturia canescens TaxID=32260 RepID=UPI001C9C53FF|nr:uncharacterized protein LOC122413175 [Venturia canescens]
MDFTQFARMDFAQLTEVIFWTILFNLLEYFPQALPGTTHNFVFVWIVNSYPQFVNSIAIASFAILMAKIRRRFEVINQVIPTMKIFQKSSSSNLEADMNNVFRLRLINKSHEKLVNAATNLSEAYGIVILTSFTVYFVASCFYLRSISLTLGNSKNSIDTAVDALWLVFYLGKYVYVINSCHSVTLQAKLAGRLLREKWTDVDHHPLKQETDLLVRQIEARNLQLTANNFFVIDYAALKMIIVGLTAYLIVVSRPTGSCDENPN